ncbi:unnamed protein product [Cochlearia groenlandica]
MIGSKATMLIFIALFLSYVMLVSVPKAEAQLIIPCTTPKQCTTMLCSNGSAQCVNKQCQCPSTTKQAVKPMATTKSRTSCKTVQDCYAKHRCYPGGATCNKGTCICLP